MNTTAFFQPTRRSALFCAWAGLFGLAGGLLAVEPTKTKEPAYENYIDISAGYNLQRGDRPGFQKNYQIQKDGYGGIEDLYIAKDINDETSFRLRGHALAGNNDYLLDLSITRAEFGYVKLGYRGFRTYYDGSGGYFPLTGHIFTIYDEDLHLDRGNLWFEAGYIPADKLNFVLRYDLQTRKGQKDSLTWMDTGIPLGASRTRNIIPSFWRIDEKRHILTGTLSRTAEKHNWALGLRYDKGDYENGRYGRRRPGEPTTDRFVTAKEGQDYDLFQIRGSFETQLTEQIRLSTAVARTKIDTTLSGSRIFGTSYDADYTNNYPTRQQRDEGYFGLRPGSELGESNMRQTIATINLLYKPKETLTVAPAFRFEKITWGNLVEFEETNFGAAPAFAPINDEVEALSDKSWKLYAGSLEVRYTGLKNLSLNFKADVSNGSGDLSEERILEPGTPAQVISVNRDTELDRKTQKYAATANWHPRANTSVAVQYFYRVRQNDYQAVRDTQPNTLTSSDRYPAYISDQDIETNDWNIRYNWRLASNLRSVTRYDYQKTTIRTQDVGLAFAESANLTSHILAEAITWSPRPSWYLQGNVNFVWDTLHTPAVNLTGLAGGLVKNSDANYLNYGLSTGYALDEQTDVFVDYNVYETKDSYVNNSSLTVPYGSDNKTQYAALTWTRRLDRRTSLTFKYAYAKNEDIPSGGHADYEAHLFYGKVQYRF